MKIIWSTGDFKPNGAPVEGFPILLGADGMINATIHDYLVELLLQSARCPSRATWANYAYSLAGFFSYLEDASRSWKEEPLHGRTSVVSDYRRELVRAGLKRSSINAKLECVARFYQYARSRGFIDGLPFAMVPVIATVTGTHSRQSARREMTCPDVKLRASKSILRILSAHEASCFLQGFENESHKLMARLQLETGIRVEELVTFPASSVSDPDMSRDQRAFVVVRLSPQEMKTKGEVERAIHVPRGLMKALWIYKATVRSLRSASPGPQLFVTQQGSAYKTRSVWKIYRANSSLPGRTVNPHLLRHTYATHTLVALSRRMNVGNALLYVRDRLGHASVKTTETYLHYADDLAVSVAEQYQSEITKMIQGGKS